MVELNQKDFVDTSGGDAETELRGIHAPEEGESYVESYYGVLEAIEKNTVYVADSQQGLPSNPDYDSVVGVAESTVSGNNDRTLHIYDGTEWVDTFEAVDEIEQELDARVTANEGDISDLQSSLGDTDSDLSSLEDRVGVNEDNIASLDSRVSSTESDITSLESDVSNNAGEIGTLQRDVSDNTSDISDLDSRVSSSESDITALQSDVSNNTSEISDLDSRVENNRVDINDLENAVGGYDVDNLESRISSNEEDIGDVPDDETLQSQINDLDSAVGGYDVANLESRISSNEEDIGDVPDDKTLQSQINDLDSELSNLDSSFSDLPPIFANLYQLNKREIAPTNPDRSNVGFGVAVTNVGGTTGERTIECTQIDTTADSELGDNSDTYELDPGEQQAFWFGWTAFSQHIGTHTFRVHTALDEFEFELEVPEP